jgi:hypothetical protein
MSLKPEEETHSISNAMVRLEKTLRIVHEDSKLYYLKEESQIAEATLRKVDNSFAKISPLMIEFADHWYGSRKQGPDAVQPSEELKERVDIKLFQTGKLDFEQMKRIMTRLNRIDDALMGLDRMNYYIKYYEDLCCHKNLGQFTEHAKLFRTSVINQAKESIESEGRRLRNQIERCNLYYQPAIQTKTLWVALASLAISCLAFLLAILKALSII